MQNNNFTKNMAYFAGNAFHITSSVQLMEDYVDYKQMCGAGILIEDNLFYGNIGMKRHNGGAGVIRCTQMLDANDIFVNDHTTSGYPLQERNATEAELESEGYGYTDPVDATLAYFDDPFANYTNITDFVVNKTQAFIRNYTLLEYGTLVTKNKFIKNHAGKKGTALLVDSISEL